MSGVLLLPLEIKSRASSVFGRHSIVPVLEKFFNLLVCLLEQRVKEMKPTLRADDLRPDDRGCGYSETGRGDSVKCIRD